MTTGNITIKLTDWETDKQELSNIRRQVFIDEQNVPEEMEWDEFDASSWQFLVLLNDKAIACARLKTEGQIGRMAVLKNFRNTGIGAQLLQFILQTALNQSINHLFMHAQASAVGFYEKHGFSSVGDIFYEAGIPHYKMQKTIK